MDDAMDAATGTRLRTATAFLAISASLVAFTSLEFMLEAVQGEFSLSPDETIVVAQIPASACLLVVFLAGVLADRFGDRRLLIAACGAYCVGALVVGLAPHPGVLLVGLSIGGVGTIGMSIVGLSILNKNFPDRRHRARAFGMFAVIAPAVAIVVPLMASTVVTQMGWRWMAAMWIGQAGVTWWMVRRAVPGRLAIRERPELVTPTLAGVALAGAAMTFSFIKVHAGLNPLAAVSAVIGVSALAVLIRVMRRHPQPTLDLRSLRAKGAVPIVTSVFVVNAVNLFLFTYLMLQYRYHQTLFDTALFLIPPQLTALAGALAGGRLSARFGNSRVAVTSLLLAAACSLSTLAVAPESSPWVLVLLVSIAAMPIAASVGSMTHAFMDLAPVDGQGATSSMRNAAVNLGIGIGGLVVGTVIFDELDADTAQDLAAFTQQADAFHLAGLFCFGAYVVAALLFMLHLRRASGIVSPEGVPAVLL
jgi:MFS family permease